MRTTGRKLLCLLTALCLLAALAPAAFLPVSAETVPENAELVWDMENLPEDLFAVDWAMNVIAAGGHTNGLSDVTRAEGKGVDGSTAVALTFNEAATLADLWGCGAYLRICEDPEAQKDWLGVTEIWFWLDASEFENSEVQLDFMVDGVHPTLDTPYWRIENGVRTEEKAVATYSTAPFGRMVLPRGFRGWLGFPVSDFKTTFGVIQNIGISCYPGSDVPYFPLSLYVDEFRIVREDTSESALNGGGDLFNEGTDAGEYTLYTNLTEVHQTVKSYGASGAWWTTAAGTCDFVDDALRLLFTDEGAGLNNYRHNVGGSVKDDLSDAGAQMQLGAAVPSPLTEDGRYVEDKDEGAYNVLMKLVELGTIDDFTLFMNTPPATMTKNGMTYCDPWGDSGTNLRDDCYEAYASYVVDMVQLYNYLGVPVSYVSPVNEPQYSWNSGSQEGCHYSAGDVQKLITLVAEELIDRCKTDITLSDVKVSFADSGTWMDKSYVNYLYMTLLSDQNALSKYDHIACHSYGSDAAAKERVAKEMKNIGAVIRFRQTEYGPTQEQADFSVKTAVEVGRVMYEDLSILDVDGWSYWLACGNGNYTDGLVYYNRNSAKVQATKRLWAMGQYARFTKNAIRVATDEYGMPSRVYSTAYVNPQDDTLVYVIVSDSDTDRTFSFAGLPAGSVAEVYETSAVRDLELRGTMTADCGYTLPAQSITTFVFHGIDLPSVVSGTHPDNASAFGAKENFDYSVFAPTEPEPVPAETEPVPAETEPAATVPAEPEPAETEPVPAATEPAETAAPAEPETETVPEPVHGTEPEKEISGGNVWLIIGICAGGAAVLAAAGVLFLKLKKKKSE